MCGLPQEEMSGNVSDSVFITFRAGDCSWHLVDRGQDAALHVTMHRAALLNKELFCPEMSIVMRLGKPGLKSSLSVSTRDHTKGPHLVICAIFGLRLGLSCCWLKRLVCSWLWERPREQMLCFSSGTTAAAGEQKRWVETYLKLKIPWKQRQKTSSQAISPYQEAISWYLLQGRKYLQGTLNDSIAVIVGFFTCFLLFCLHVACIRAIKVVWWRIILGVITHFGSPSLVVFLLTLCSAHQRSPQTRIDI